MSAYVFAVVCEAEDDRRVGTTLADRVLCSEVEWIEPESLDHFRRWQGLAEGSSHLEWHEVRKLLDRTGIKAHGHFRNKPAEPDARAARRVLLMLSGGSRVPDAVVLIRDSDGQEKRRAGLEQARNDRSWPFPIAIGFAHLNRECWVLAGFEPWNQAEEESLSSLRQELGFDPRLRPESLRGKPGEARHAKLVLERLIGDDKDREEACWTGCDLEVLRTRGASTGLAEYLDEVRDRIVPIFGVPKA